MKVAPWKMTLAGIGLAVSTFLLPGCGSSDTLADLVNEQANSGGNQTPVGPAPVFSFDVINTYPHQTDAFTEGLVYENNRLFESNGLVGQSNLRELNLTTGAVVREVANDPAQFAEGLALRAGRFYQLTLSSGVTNLFDQATFSAIPGLPTRTPAWGLAYIPGSDRFAFSDGTSTLRFLAPDSTLTEVGSVTVTDNGVAVDQLNELEYVNGVILANRFLTDEIVAIEPSTGRVLYRVDLSGIIDKAANGLGLNDVLNGIAYDPSGDRLFVTGKRWPFLYQIEIVAN